VSFELVYTSAPRGLRDGASGFCTVAATEGIPRPLHEKLESLSGYSRSEVMAGIEPPVNHSHLIVRIQRTVYHVVSRIADAGIDYTGRTNKIAHHLALTSDEIARFPTGPASLLSDHAFWHTDWSAGPETLPVGNVPNAYPAGVSDFDTWEAAFGDAGWAGVLGQAIADGMKPVSVIVPPAEDTLLMLNEALQLVRPDDRWKVCFSTFFSRLSPGTQCHWRFVLDGTPEARKLRARSPGLLVDPLGSSGDPPDGNAFVEAAREGKPADVHNMPKATTQRSGAAVVRQSGARAVRRPSGTHRRHPASGSGRRTARERLEYVEEYEDDGVDLTDQRSTGKRRSKPKTGVWLVFALLLAVMAMLVYFGIRQLS
jgi:hypothetical protein